MSSGPIGRRVIDWAASLQRSGEFISTLAEAIEMAMEGHQMKHSHLALSYSLLQIAIDQAAAVTSIGNEMEEEGMRLVRAA